MWLDGTWRLHHLVIDWYHLMLSWMEFLHCSKFQCKNQYGIYICVILQEYTHVHIMCFLVSMFPLLQLYDKHVNLSIIGYFGVVRTISLHQDRLPASPSGSREEVEHSFSTYPKWVRKQNVVILSFVQWSIHFVQLIIVSVYFHYFVCTCVLFMNDCAVTLITKSHSLVWFNLCTVRKLQGVLPISIVNSHLG